MTQPDLFDTPPAIELNPRRRRPIHPGNHLASSVPRGVRATWCRHCGAPILTGLDEDVCAVAAWVDLTPLDAMGQMIATLAVPTRSTYTLYVPAGKSARLIRRRWWSHTRWPVAGRQHLRYDVVPEHRCNQPLPAVPSRLEPEPTQRGVSHVPPPF